MLLVRHFDVDHNYVRPQWSQVPSLMATSFQTKYTLIDTRICSRLGLKVGNVV